MNNRSEVGFIYIDDNRILLDELTFSELLEENPHDFGGRKELEDVPSKILLSNDEFKKAAKISKDEDVEITIKCGEYEGDYLSITIEMNKEDDTYLLAEYNTRDYKIDEDNYFESVYKVYQILPNYMIEDKNKIRKVYEFEWSSSQGNCGAEELLNILKANPIRLSNR